MRFQKNIFRCGRLAFTLIELLVVISIIAILAGLVLSGVMGVKAKGMVGKAKVDVVTIAAAVTQYETEYGLPPAPKAVWDFSAVNSKTNDFTYGIFNSIRTFGTLGYQATNAQLVAILRNTGPSPFLNGLAVAGNPKKISFLDAPISPNNISGGVGLDGNFRDPWGNPYIISTDLDASGTTMDGYYSDLRKQKTSLPPEIAGSVLVWSLGPDTMIETNITAVPSGTSNPALALKYRANADNVLSWDK